MMTESTQNTIIEQHIDTAQVPNLQATNALGLLADASGLSKQKLKEAMSKGAVWLTRGKQVRPLRRKSAKLKAGDLLHLYYNPSVISQQVTRPTLIADEGDYSVWYKPYGVWSQGSKWGDHCSIGRLVEEAFDFQRQSYVVHRLDRATEGLIVVAHHKKAAAELSALFAKRLVDKRYRAKVRGQFPDSPQTIEEPIDHKPAKSVASLLEYDKQRNESLLDVRIFTGRKHQIRIHLAALGFPIIGDRLYGKAQVDAPDLQLTAYRLSFRCPWSGEQREYRLD